eukprot:c22625_g1_i1 orf=566-1366(-)
MPTRTIKVSNLSPRATKLEIKEFFSFSGEIEHIELQSEGDGSQAAYVTFKDPEALNTALLLSGATIVDQSVTITPAEDYHFSSAVYSPGNSMTGEGMQPLGGAGSAMTKAQDVITSMLAKGYVLSKDAMSKARAIDDKHHLTANATASVSSLDKKIGLSQKLSAGTAAVNERFKAMDQKYEVSEKTRSAFAAAEQKVNSAGSALMKNKYVFASASWLTGAFNRAVKTAGEVGQKAIDKAQSSERQSNDPTPGFYGTDHEGDGLSRG